MRCGKGLLIIGFFIFYFGDFIIAQSLVDVDYACNGDGTFDATITYNPVGGEYLDFTLDCDGFTWQFSCFDPAMVDTIGYCVSLYLPVCACNGFSYSNECYANKAGYEIITDMPCDGSEVISLVVSGIPSCYAGDFTFSWSDFNGNDMGGFDVYIEFVCDDVCEILDPGLSGISCDDNGTPSDPLDDRIAFNLDPQRCGTEATYQVKGAGFSDAGYYDQNTKFTLPSGSAGAGKQNITIVDISGLCALGFMITDPGVCSMANPPKIDFTDVTNQAFPGGLPNGIMDATVGDIDRDGDMDILFMTASNGVRYYRNGSGIYTEIQNFSCGAIAGELIDIDGDNDLDLVMSRNCGTNQDDVTEIYENMGGNQPFQISLLKIDEDAKAFSQVDIDNDGTAELIMNRNSYYNNKSPIYADYGLRIYERMLNNFQLIENVISDIGGIPVADFDNDLDYDVIAPDNISSFAYRNNSGVLVKELLGAIQFFTGSNRMAIGDLNDNGKSDIASTGRIILDPLSNAQYRSLTGTHAIDLADMDGDGSLDVLAGGAKSWGSPGLVYNNSSLFDQRQDLVSTKSYRFIPIDYQLDKRVDVLYLPDFDNLEKPKLFRNQTGIQNVLPPAPGGLNEVVSSDSISFSWTPVAGDETSFPTYNLYVYNKGTGEPVMMPASDLQSGFNFRMHRGNTEYNAGWYLRDLEENQEYCWKVQAIDHSYAGGPWSNERCITNCGLQSPLSNQAQFCIKDAVVLDATVVDCPDCTYQWSGGPTTPTWSVNQPGPKIITITSGACSVKDTVMVSAVDYSFSLGQDTTLCTTGTYFLNSSVVCPGCTFSWELDGTLIPGANASYLDVQSSGAYTLTVASNLPGCSFLDDIEISFDPSLLSFTFPVDTFYCASGPLLLSAPLVPGATYNWKKGNVSVMNGNLLTINSPGFYQLEVTSGTGCFVSSNFQVDQLNLAFELGPGNQWYCQGQEMVLQGPVDPNLKYDWYRNGMSIPVQANNLLVNLPGTYVLEVSENTLCPYRDTVIITEAPLPIADAGADQSLTCDLPIISLQAGNQNSSWSYSWLDLNDNLLQTGPAFVVGDSGVFILAVVDPATACAARDTVWIDKLTDIPVIDSIAVGLPTCAGGKDGFVVVVHISGGSGDYQYRLDGGTFSSEAYFSDLAEGQYTLEVRDDVGCLLKFPVTIDDPLPITISLSGLPVGPIPADTTIVLEAVLTNHALPLKEIKWTIPAITCLDPACLQMSFSAIVSGSYQVMVTDADGCTVALAFDIDVSITGIGTDPGSEIVTPNGDGKNDMLTFPELDDPSAWPRNELFIFNRWGQLIHYAQPYNNDWDGRASNGDPIPEGTYYYVLHLHLSDGEQRLGYVTLVRSE